MQIRYGNALLEANGAGLTIAKRTLENAANIPYETEVVAAITGYITGTTAQIVAKSNNLERAMAVPYQDLVLTANDGSIALRLANAGSTTGTRCLSGVNYPEFRGAEFVSYRTFQFDVTACYPLTPGALVILDFMETLETNDGGPVYDFQRPANAAPIKVQLFRQTESRATQSGYAVTQGPSPTSYLSAPGPIFPGALLQSPPVKRSSKRLGAQKWECRIEWAYIMAAVQPLVGLPNSWR